jgi:uncharacterized membrane protein
MYNVKTIFYSEVDMDYITCILLIYFGISVVLTILAILVAEYNGKSMDIFSILFLLYTSPILMPMAIKNVIKKMRKKDDI